MEPDRHSLCNIVSHIAYNQKQHMVCILKKLTIVLGLINPVC